MILHPRQELATEAAPTKAKLCEKFHFLDIELTVTGIQFDRQRKSRRRKPEAHSFDKEGSADSGLNPKRLGLLL